MIIGVGIDVCDVDRFAESIERRPGLVTRIFTPAEAERPIASKAARFAAKEALAKATNPQELEMNFKGIFLDESRRILG
jgi:holo-[acyl-carrier protein] synthase